MILEAGVGLPRDMCTQERPQRIINIQPERRKSQTLTLKQIYINKSGCKMCLLSVHKYGVCLYLVFHFVFIVLFEGATRESCTQRC